VPVEVEVSEEDMELPESTPTFHHSLHLRYATHQSYMISKRVKCHQVGSTCHAAAAAFRVESEG
jgi:hypothetical protein